RGDGGIGAGAFFGQPSTLYALDLSADQMRSVQAVLRTHGPALRRLAAEERAATRAIDDQRVGEGGVTEDALDAPARPELDTRSALTHERVATALAVRGALTPDQIREVASIRAGVAHLRVAPVQ